MSFTEICNSASGGFLGNNIFGAEWVQLVFLALGASTLIMAVLFMVSSFLRNIQYEAWVKYEIYQILAIAVFMIFIAWIVGQMCSFDISFLGERYSVANDNHTPYKAAENYLRDMKIAGKELYWILMVAYSVVARLAEPVWNSIPLGVGVTLQPFAGLAAIKSVIMLLSKGWMISYIVLLTEMAILEYSRRAMFGFLLPIGAVLMAFSPTRQFGGAMVAIALGLFFVLPLCLTFNDLMLYDLVNQPINETLTGIKAADPDFDSDKLLNNLYGEIGDSSKRDMNILNSAKWFLNPLTLISRYSIAVVVFTAINFTVTVQVIREFSALLGSEVDVSNLTRFI
jgi:hypothetical protein